MQMNRLFDKDGNRKYLTPQERERFREATLAVSRSKRLFGLMLYHTGCRISEGLELRNKGVDFSSGCATVRTLKQRNGKVKFRQIPLPDDYLQALDDAYDLRTLQKRNNRTRNDFVWGWSRKYGWLVITEIMEKAGLQGIHATPKGLRHAFAIACIDKSIPLNMVQKWMGHSSIQNTAIYADALGHEERKLAARLWTN